MVLAQRVVYPSISMEGIGKTKKSLQRGNWCSRQHFDLRPEPGVLIHLSWAFENFVIITAVSVSTLATQGSILHTGRDF
jgi:hypothetical protein